MQKVDTKLWRNYQILISQEVSEALGLKPSDGIRFIIDNQRFVLKRRWTK